MRTDKHYEVRNSVTDGETVMKPVNFFISSNFYTGVQFVPLREHNSCPDQTFIAEWEITTVCYASCMQHAMC